MQVREPWTLPIIRTDLFDLPVAYREMFAAGPIQAARLPNGRTVWVLTGHSEIRGLLTDPRTTADRAHPNFPSFDASGGTATALIAGSDPFLVSMDPPAHTHARNQLKREFEQRRIRELAPVVQEIIDTTLTRLLSGPKPADLVSEFALRVPSLVICRLLGVPYTDHDFFESRTPALIDSTASPQRCRAAFTEIHGYLTDLIARREARPTDDIIGNYVRATRAGGAYRRETLVSHAFLLLIAGHETTANQIALSVLALLRRPELSARLRAEPALVPRAVEEMLRYFTIVDSVSRVATADITIGANTIRAGDGIVMVCSLANRDPDVFDEPDDLEFARGDRRHLSFGFGPHQCLGQGLARLELELALRSVITRLPGLALAVPAGHLEYKGTTSAFGVKRLPVVW
ncbi:cytochrome P450 [Nocardia arthritidis]|uniref:Cytochrome P450 n=1 Tax=Nocardia arthritidis TaxID=228602 RepID=A0A6G9YG03_9NOCA|nr:cytochrome P450 [Nocardia arthritidis]QIS12149.1 cytochrome P450 [Nocardia arthritidis]